jgi:hypothetical protein
MNQSETGGGDEDSYWLGGRRGKPRSISFAKERAISTTE